MSFTSPVDSAAVAAPRWSDFYVSAIARAISQCGDILAATALALVLQAHGAGGLAVAGIMLAAAVPLVVLRPIVGRIADRYDSRTILVTTGLFQVAVCVVLAFVAQPVAIIALVAVLAAGASLVGPTLGALTPQIVGRANLAKASGISQTAVTAGMLVAPALGGLLVGAYGARVPLLIDAATYLAIPLAGLVIKTRRGGRFGADPAGLLATAAGTAGASGAAGAGRAYRMRDDALLWPLMILVTAVLAAISAINVVDVFFVKETLHSTPTVYGLIGMVWMLGMVGGAMVFSRLPSEDTRTARRLLLLLGGSSMTIGVAGLVPQVGWMVPLWLVGGMINAGENVSIGVLLGSRVPAAFRGRAGATFNSLAAGANALGFVLGGALLAVASPRVLLIGGGAAGLACVAAFAGHLLRAIARERAAASEVATADATVTVDVVPAGPAAA